jgi:microcystin-dependent protein
VLGALAAGAWFSRGARSAEAQVDHPYVGEIRMFAGDFAPVGWALCDGQLLPIAENETLFALIGTTYGGDGQSTFALPDLRGRAPVHMGTGAGTTWTIGETAGAEVVTLTIHQIPAHTHSAGASSSLGSSDGPAGLVPAMDASGAPRFGTVADGALGASALTLVGGSVPHNNMQPYLTVNFIISLFGVFPSQV